MLKANPYLQSAFLSSPKHFKNVQATIYSILMAQKKYGNEYKKWRSFLDESDWWPTDRIAEFQAASIKAIISSSLNNSRFYSNFPIYKILLDSNDILADIRKLPIINKRIVLDNYENIIAKHSIYSKKYHRFTSSGTTGTSLVVAMNSECYQREYAFRWKYFSIAGAAKSNRFAFFLGNRLFPANQSHPPYSIIDYYQKGIFFSIFHLSSETISDYVKTFNSFNADYVRGYPSALYAFVQLAKSKNLSVKCIKAVFSGSEVLHPYQKEAIQEVFQAPIYQWYGQVETTVNIHECDSHRLHIKEEYGLLEIINDQGCDAAPGEIGSAIGTGWGNVAFPLIRYDTGDNMILSHEKSCPCGRAGRIIEKILGRDEDVVMTPEGRYVGRLDFIFKPITTVQEAQIIQETINKIVIRVVPLTNYTIKDREKIISIIKQYLGTSIKYAIEEVPSLERTKAGKVKYVISNIQNAI